MATEIERKFLVTSDIYKNEAFASYHIIQGYISTENGITVRVRIRDNQGYITIKGATNKSGLSRFEWEKEITLNDAKQLINLCNGKVIDKTRYLVKTGDLFYEVDDFHGDNEGLVIAEIELPTEESPFEKREWIGKEVTGNKKYYNSMLLSHPYKEWLP